MLVCFAAQPNNVGVLTKLAQFYYRLDELGLAKEFADRLVELAPEQALSHSILSNIHNASHASIQDVDKAIAHADKAIIHAKKAIELDPTISNPYVSMFRSYNRLGKFELALDTLDRLEEVVDSTAYVHYWRGLVYRGAKRYEEALESGLKALESDPDRVVFLASVAASYRLCGASEKAIPIYDTIIKKTPGNWGSHAERVKTLLELNHFKEAESELRKLWHYRTRYPEVLILFTDALAGQGEYEMALAELRHLLETDPSEAVKKQFENIRKAADKAGAIDGL